MTSNKKKAGRKGAGVRREITDYDTQEVTPFIDPSSPISLGDLGLTLPAQPPTQVISVRLPTPLLNELRAIGSQDDVPYQALIKLFLTDAVEKKRKKAA